MSYTKDNDSDYENGMFKPVMFPRQFIPPIVLKPILTGRLIVDVVGDSVWEFEPGEWIHTTVNGQGDLLVRASGSRTIAYFPAGAWRGWVLR